MVRALTLLILIILLCSCEKEKIVFNLGANEDFELPLLLRLDEKDCLYDHQRAILKYSISSGDLKDFEPLIQFPKHSTIFFNNQELANGKRNDLGNLQLNMPYPITITAKGEQRQLSLYFTDIPTVQIITHDAIYNEPKTLARFILNNPDHNDDPEVQWVGVEHRGASSLKYDKKSMTVGIYADKSLDYPESQSFFGLNSNEKWILNAMYTDLSRLRNKVSFELWKSLDHPTNTSEHVAIESRFVEVFINNQAMGLYTFTERYTPELLNLSSQAIMFKGIENSSYSKFFSSPKRSPSTSLWADWEQIVPDPSYQLEWRDFEALLTLTSEGSDAEFKAKIPQMLDLDNVVDYHLFVNLLGGGDNVGKNWHLLKRSDGEKFVIVPWDLDATWGRNAASQEVATDLYVTNGLFERLQALNPDSYNERLRARWKDLRENQFSDTSLNTLFSKNFNELRSYDIMKWENSIWDADINLEDEEVYITDWFLLKLNYLDQVFTD